MNTYIATFYSHFGAMRYKKDCESAGYVAKMMPVPRDLSSSCGTCVRVVGDIADPLAIMQEEIEQIVRVADGGYEVLYQAENS